MSEDFDSIICFGGVDWWYHNRGHYDLQMMRHIKSKVPVLYVNSIGMRTPKVSEGQIFFKRFRKKIRSIFRGLTRVDTAFFVYSALSIPVNSSAFLDRLNGLQIAWQIKKTARKIGFKNPLIWVACPTALTCLNHLEPHHLVYQRTDRFEAFEGANQDRIRKFDQLLKAKAGLTLFCSKKLYETEKDQCSRSLLVDHGVDFEVFAKAGQFQKPSEEPTDIAKIASPRVGFVGGIDALTFDPMLFNQIVTAMPDVQFVLVGDCSLPIGWCTSTNVHLLGQKDYNQVPGYMAACDVLIMPWNDSQWIASCNPIKLKEYLAIGRPVISTFFPELAQYRQQVTTASCADEFVPAIRKAIASPHGESSRRERVKCHTWMTKSKTVWKALISLKS